MKVEISNGELVDKVTILAIKLERMEQEGRRANVRREFEILREAMVSMGIALGHSAIMAIFSNQVSDDRQGWVMGVTGAVVSLSILVSAIINAFLSDLNPRNPFWLALVAYILGFIAITHYCQRKKK